MSLKPPFYVISDTHFYHDNIVKYCNRMEHTGGRDHNEYMVEKWNSVVGPDDPILHLGDVFVWFKDGQGKFVSDILPRLNGKKYLIMGNHDKAKPSEFERMGFTVLEPFSIPYKGYTVEFNHYPADYGTIDPNGKVIRVHGHIHNNGYPKGKGNDGWKEGSSPREAMQVNLSVEMIDYTPQPIEAVLAQYVR